MADHTITFTDEQEKCIADKIVDFDAWLQGAADGQANQNKKRIISEWQLKLMADPSVTTITAIESEFLTAVFARTDYKDRSARDAEAREEERLRKEVAAASAAE